MSRFNYENQINLNLIFPFRYHQKSIKDTIARLKSYNIKYNTWYNIFISCSVYCFIFSRSLCNLMILNFEIFQNGSFICDMFWDLEVLPALQNIQKACERVLFLVILGTDGLQHALLPGDWFLGFVLRLFIPNRKAHHILWF